MAQDDSYFRLRIPDVLKEKIAEASAVNRRSMNAEIIAMLEAALGSNYDLEEVGGMVNDHEERLRQLEKDVYKLLDEGGHIRDWK